jgi:PKD repeat protein
MTLPSPRIVVVAAALLLGGSGVAAAATLYAASGGGGSSCTAASPCSLTSAVQQASAGDTVVLATGIYTGTGSEVVAIAKDLTLTGGWDGIAADASSLDAGLYPALLSGEGARRVMTVQSNTVTLNGLTIVDGEADLSGGGIDATGSHLTLAGCILRGNFTSASSGDALGGGLHLDGGMLTVRDSTFVANAARSPDQPAGGAIAVTGDAGADVESSRFAGNDAWNGSALALYGTGTQTVHACSFYRNGMDDSGRAAGGYGGALSVAWGSLTVEDSLFDSNNAGNEGGAMRISFADVTLARNRIFGNEAGSGAALALLSCPTSCTLVNNILAKNHTSNSSAAAVRIVGSTVSLLHNTIVGEGTAVDQHGVDLESGCTATFTNNIIVRQSVGVSPDSTSSASLDATVWGDGDWANGSNVGGTGTITSQTHDVTGSPSFVDPTNRDYHIAADSAALDAGVATSVATDIDGDARPFGPAPDIGADERVSGSGTLKAWATAAPLAPAQGATVTFDGEATGGTSPYSFSWTFGDGGTSTEQRPTHAFSAAGAYAASLTVTDGASAHASVSVTILVIATSCQLTCSASVPTTAVPESPVAFTGSASVGGCSNMPSFAWSFGDGASSSQQSPSHAYATAGSYPWSLQVTAGDAACTRQGTIAVTGPGGYVYLIPSVAHLPGAHTTVWRTDVAAYDADSADASLTLEYLTDGAPVTRTATLAAGTMVEWQNILEGLFGVSPGANTSGTLKITSTARLLLTSRTYNQTSGGTYGQYYPACGSDCGITMGQDGRLLQLRKNADSRTNIGFLDLGNNECSVRLYLYDAAGTQVGHALDFTVPADRWLQQYDVFAAAGAGNHDAAFARVEVTTSGCQVWAYASVIDAKTGDPVTIPVLVP